MRRLGDLGGGTELIADCDESGAVVADSMAARNAANSSGAS